MFIKIGSVISSTTLKLDFNCILVGSGFKVFNNNSCFRGPLFNNTLIQGTKTSLPKLIENSLKYEDASISAIKPLTALSNVWFTVLGEVDFISLLLLDTSFIIKGKSEVLNILFFSIFIFNLNWPVI